MKITHHLNDVAFINLLKDLLSTSYSWQFDTAGGSQYTITLDEDHDKTKVQKEIYEWLKRRVEE